MSELIERAKEITKATADVLTRAEPMTTAEYKRLIPDLATVRGQVESRYLAIRPSMNGRDAGSVRTRLLETGTTEQIEALNVEFSQIDALYHQLHAQTKAMDAKRREAGVREARQELPAKFGEIEKKLAAAEEALAAFDSALRDLRHSYDDAYNTRMLLVRNSHQAPGASVELGRRLAGLAASIYAKRIEGEGLFSRSIPEMADSLGIEKPAQQSRAA